jgi:ADP-ribosylglycohydrolase
MDAICIGYDTDTQGAVMGAMVGALCGKFYDEGMVEGIIGYTSITQIMTEYTESLGV